MAPPNCFIALGWALTALSPSRRLGPIAHRGAIASRKSISGRPPSSRDPRDQIESAARYVNVNRSTIAGWHGWSHSRDESQVSLA